MGEEVPDGIIPILITGPTQTIINCVIDEDVTEENPHKFLPKDVFISDIQKRAAVSDFSPFKKELNAFEGTEILVVMDAEFLYGQNFFLCLGEEAVNKFLYPNGVPGEAGPDGQIVVPG